MSAVTQEYLQLMRHFLDESISPDEFQGRFLEKFKTETRTLSEGVYQTLDKVFGDLDAFTSDDLLRQRVNKETRKWSPELKQLRVRVASAVQALESEVVS